MLYSTDLTDGQFKLIAKLLPKVKLTKPCTYTKHYLLNAILYVLKTGCQWRMLPNDYPPFRTVHKYFRKLWVLGIMESILFELNNKIIKSQLVNRENNTLKLIIDSKSIDSAERLKAKYKGIDGHKKVSGVKLFELVDTNNLCWRSLVLPANTAEIIGAKKIIAQTFESRKKPIVKFILGDKAFNGAEFEKEIYRKYGIVVLGIEKKQNRKFNLPEDIKLHQHRSEIKDSIIKPHRYKVEQNFAHLVHSRRITRVYEREVKSYATFVKLRHMQLAIKKLSG